MRIYSHPDCLRHNAGPGHPESPARLAAVVAALREALPELEWLDAPAAERTQIERGHSAGLLRQLLDQPISVLRRIDADTALCPDSPAAALRAVGAVCAAIDAAMTGEALRSFCAVRPPGHHATRDTAMGFCLLNSIALGALHAIARHGLERVAVIDFDVHHGNGTQDILWNEPRTLYLSTHQSPLYPGTGAASERGGCDNIVNLPLSEGSGGVEWHQAYEKNLLPCIDAFGPQLLLISAGFDAHRLDPLAGLNLDAEDFSWLTTELRRIAERHAQGRMVSTLEGGYSLTALRESSVAHVRAMI